MKNYDLIPGILIFGCAFICFLSPPLFAGDITPSTLAVFSNQDRPAARFDHSLHEDAADCDQCHHVLDTDTNRLVYSEGEEAACTECHAPQQDGNILANRDASHASCTQCHRTLKKEKKQAGPTTCGECHKK